MEKELTPIEPIEYPIEEEVQETPCTIIKDGKVSKLTFTPDDKYNIGESFEDYLDGKMVILSDEQVAFYEAHPNASISEVWGMKIIEIIHEPYVPTNEDYEILVNNKIREKYSASRELALHRQRDEKLDEWREYYDYCEECKQEAKTELFGNNS